MVSIMYGSLGPAGWLTSPRAILDQMYADLYAANASQSVLGKEQTPSIPNIVARYQGNPPVMAQALETLLTQHYSSVFQSVDVQVQVLSTQAMQNNFTAGLEIYIQVTTTDGKTANLSKTLSIAGQTVVTDLFGLVSEIRYSPSGEILGVINNGHSF